MRNGNWLKSVLASVAAVAVLIGSPGLVHALIVPTVGSGTLVMQMDPASGVSVDGSNNVISWTDQTGTGDGLGGVFSPTATSSAVTLVASGLNGLPVIRFTNGYLQTSTATTSTFTNAINSAVGQAHGLTMFVVTSGSTNSQGLFDSDPSTASPFRFYPSNSIDPDNFAPHDTLSALDTNGTVLGFTLESDRTGGDNNRYIFTGSENKKSAPFTGIDLGQTNANGSGSLSGWGNPVIGSINKGFANYNGDIAEILIYTGTLSPTDFNTVQNALITDFLFAPEPASMSLVMIGAGAMLLKRGRRV